MDIKKLQAFLYERKIKLMDMERIAKGKAKLAIIGQLQAIDSLFQYLSSQQEETDMEKLKLSLDAQAIPLEELKPRARESQLADAIMEFIETIPPGQAKPINAPGVSPRTVLTTVYAMKKKGILPENILAISRNNGKEAYIGKAKESNGDSKSKGKGK